MEELTSTTTTHTSLTEQNRAVVQAFYNAIIAGDTDGFVSVSAEDMVVHQPSFLPYGKTYRGRDAELRIFIHEAQTMIGAS